MSRNTIYYISSLPGAGKTKWSVEKMREFLQQDSGIIFYVAPTKDLLTEVSTNLQRGLDKTARRKIYEIVSDRRSSAINIQQKVFGLLVGGEDSNGEAFRTAKGGSVFLLTHEGFVRLPGSLPRKEEIQVIFDEARKFTAKLQPVKLSNSKENKLFASLVDTNSRDILNEDGESTGFRKFSMRERPRILKKLTESVSGRKQYAALEDAIDAATNSRTDLYVKKAEKGKEFEFYEVLMPSRVFEGYKEVIIMAAFLEDSQMWHLLKSSNRITLVPIENHPKYPETKTYFTSETQKIRERFSKVCLFPLTEQTKPLSMSRLDSAIMVPSNDYNTIKGTLEEIGIDSTIPLIAHLKGTSLTEPDAKMRKAMRFLRDYSVKPDPFRWYLRAAKRFTKVLESEGKIRKTILVVTNNNAPKKYQQAKYPEWTNISSVSHGLNKYLGSNTMIFAAALNPKPALVRLYKVLLKDYDWTKDHLAESFVQSVTRLCVRDTKSEIVAYVIMPDTAMAELLREKMLSRPIISMRATDKMNMVALGTLNVSKKTKTKIESGSDTKAKAKIKAKDKSKKWNSSDLNKELTKKRSLRSYYKRKIEEASPTEKLKMSAKIDSINRDIEELLEKKPS